MGTEVRATDARGTQGRIARPGEHAPGSGFRCARAGSGGGLMTAVGPVLRVYDAAEKAARAAELEKAPDAAELRAKAEALCEVLVAAEAAQDEAHKVYVGE